MGQPQHKEWSEKRRRYRVYLLQFIVTISSKPFSITYILSEQKKNSSQLTTYHSSTVRQSSHTIPSSDCQIVIIIIDSLQLTPTQTNNAGISHRAAVFMGTTTQTLHIKSVHMCRDRLLPKTVPHLQRLNVQGSYRTMRTYCVNDMIPTWHTVALLFTMFQNSKHEGFIHKFLPADFIFARSLDICCVWGARTWNGNPDRKLVTCLFFGIKDIVTFVHIHRTLRDRARLQIEQIETGQQFDNKKIQSKWPLGRETKHHYKKPHVSIAWISNTFFRTYCKVLANSPLHKSTTILSLFTTVPPAKVWEFWMVASGRQNEENNLTIKLNEWE